MTDDQIIGLANILHGKVKKEDTAKFIQFAKGVVQFEREECARVADLVAKEIDDTNGTATYIAAAIRSKT